MREDYAAVALASSPDALRADNPAQQLHDDLRRGRRRRSPRRRRGSDAARDGDHARRRRASRSPPCRRSIAGARVEYRRDGLTEWYINGPRGLEQGFTLAAPPAGARSSSRLALAVTGDGADAGGGWRAADR